MAPRRAAASTAHGSPPYGATPPIEQRIAAEVAAHGEEQVVTRSVSLLAGNNEGEEFLLVVGGEHARGILDGAPVLYWPELWGTRALLYAWHESAEPAVIAALGNRSWRVREMAARVAALRSVALDDATVLADDHPRVRAAAARAFAATATDPGPLQALLNDSDIAVRRAAQESIAAIRARVG